MELRRITCRRIVELSEAGSYVRVLNIRIFLQLGLKLVFDHFDVFLFDHHTVLVNVTNDKLAGTIPHGIQMQQDLLCGGVAGDEDARGDLDVVAV